MMKTPVMLVHVIAVCFGLAAVSGAPAMALASRGKPQATIVLGPDATETERYAAAQLAAYLRRVTGAEFQVTDDASVSGSRIFVGQTAAAKQKVGKFDWASLRTDGIIVRTVGNDLIVSGDRPRGSMYAVYAFLEDQLGVRWWTAGTETVPRRPELSVGSLNVTYRPPFAFRDIFARGVFQEGGEFATRMRLNGHWAPVPPGKGGHYSILGMVHTFYELLPPSKYFNAHPEWYSEVNGKRVGAGAQLCLTNAEMARELLAQALVWIKQAPEAGIVSISQNDWGGACSCGECTALVARTGSQSGALIAFVNSIAEGIEKEYPGFLVETLAYTYTRQAPRNIRPRDNVLVRLCSIECDFAHPLTARSNALFHGNLQEWKRVSKRLYVWDYTANFTSLLIPHSNLQVLGDNLRAFRANNVIGVFEQGDGYNPEAAFGPLKTWVLCKLMWDPRLDERALVREFLEGYYGKAAPYLAEYLDVMEKVVLDQNMYLSCSISKPTYYSAAYLTRGNEAMQKALAAVKGDPESFRRVRVQNLALQHLLIVTKHQLALSDTSVPGVDWQNIAADYLGLSDATGNVYLGENAKMSDTYRASLATRAAAPLSVRKPTSPASCERLASADWLDFQEDRFTLIGEGAWVKVAPDEGASDGMAAVMPGSSNEWAIQLPVQSNDAITRTVNIRASIRVTAKATSGPAFSFGVYDQTTGTAPAAVTVTLGQTHDSEYHEYSLGEVELKAGMFIYLAPPGNGDVVDSVAVDRIFFIAVR